MFGPSLRGLWVPTVLHRALRDAPGVSVTSTVLRRVLRGALGTYIALVVHVNDIYGLILGFTSKYKVTGPWKVRITIDQGGFQLGIYQHK